MAQSRVFIVSNRLPVSFEKGKISKGQGGLVTAITGIKSAQEFIWVGSTIKQKDNQQFVSALKKDRGRMKYSPLFLEAQTYKTFYNKFCNDVLWPLLHYETELVKFSPEAWEVYKQVNYEFAQKLAKETKAADNVWVHDFHLFLLPKYLKQLRPNLKVGFFLHVPFPSSEITRQLPVAKELLEGVLHSDLIGFHDYGYLSHFTSSVRKLVNVDEIRSLYIRKQNHRTKLGVFPASIDTQKFQNLTEAKKTKDVLNRWAQQQGPRKIRHVLGIDRLDYIKGIDLKLKIFEKFLKDHPEMVGKVSLVQIAIPSRVDVPEYIQLRNEVESMVGKINGEFGQANYTPVKYIFRSITPSELAALYHSSECLLITSKRDGMNLIAIEYTVSQNEKNPGCLVLSEFAGAISTLSSALSINPWDTQKSADQLYRALTMRLKERRERVIPMKRFYEGYTATAWAKRFLKDLNVIKPTQGKTVLVDVGKKEFLRRFKSIERIALFLDYDGTLAPIADSPENAMMSAKMRNILKKLSTNKKVDVVVVSGRNREFLVKQTKGMQLGLCAEHGAFFKAHQKNWKCLVSDPKKRWYSPVRKIMKDFALRVPHSFVEQKEYALCWHYRNSPKDFADFQATKLKTELESLMYEWPITTIEGKKIIEVKDFSSSKGTFVRWFLNQPEGTVPKNILPVAIGDDTTDEYMFQEVNDMGGVSIKVGLESTTARYRLDHQSDVLALLTFINDLS
jgi:trehalose 6-phosphate synthase/phosphatase